MKIQRLLLVSCLSELAIAPSICKMLSQTLEATKNEKLVRLILHFNDRNENLCLDTSDFNQSKKMTPSKC